MNSKKAIFLRGLPGSGKSTLANIISPHNVAADDWFDKYNNGVFNPEYLKIAHGWCKDQFSQMLEQGCDVVVVHNTFTESWEIADYIRMSNGYDYQWHTVIVENRHESDSVHNVPDKVMEKMHNRFDICLGWEY